MSAPLDSFIRFEPIYQTRVWGGRLLAERFGRDLPDLELPFGESWEISAREEADSRILGGSLDGRRLTELWADPGLRRALFGEGAPEADRFPLLFKILDARDTLSIQVHPPASVAAALGGEPKTEVWYIADAAAGAMLYVGVKEGIDEARFREALASGEAESCVHSVPVSKGQHLAIPSGRLHAIGAGLLIYEIQQNSDTTYRVYDWNRPGIDGKPRELHVEGRPVELTPREFDLLYFFARHPGKVFSRMDLLTQVWGYRYEGYEHTVNTHINRLRLKIETDPANPCRILTAWGRGYKFGSAGEAER